MKRSSLAVALASLCSLLPLAACNSGIAAVFGASDSDSSTSSPSTIAAFSVTDAEESPATIRFRLVDADGGTARVSLYYQVPGGELELLTQLGGASNPQDFAASGPGTEHILVWDFASETDLPADSSFTGDVMVSAQLDGATSAVLGANATMLGLGNDPPEVTAVGTPAAEISGIVAIGTSLADTSGDAISLRVEFQIDGEEPWNLARPGGESTTPDFAFSGLIAPPEGTTVNFFWDTNADLPLLERNVRLRLTPIDPTTPGDPFVTEPFRVDNNSESIIDLNDGLISVDGVDVLGGIAIPFTVRDAESDPVRVIFQWRRPGTSFPELPASPDEVFAAQADPVLRAELRICSEKVSHDRGRPIVESETILRLPELGTSEVVVPTPDYVGRTLEILRPIESAVDASAGWTAGPITGLVAAEPVGDGVEALVLDEPGPGTWRVQRVVVATGEIVSESASGVGTPTALAIDAREEYGFVANDLGGSWSVARFELATGTLDGSATGTGTGGVRGLAAISGSMLAASVEDRLERITFATTPATVSNITRGLDDPRGLCVDPLSRETLLVAERGADRVAVVDWLRMAVVGDALTSETALDFSAPLDVDVDLHGERVVVITETEDGSRELRAFNRRSAYDLDGSGTQRQLVYRLCDLPAGATTVAAGPDRLRLITDPTVDGIVAIGGVEQRRTIVAAAPDDTRVTLASPLAPVFDEPRTWRVKRGNDLFATSPEGRNHVFAWDSSDMVRGGKVLLRALVFDSEFGLDAQTVVERDVVSTIGVAREVVDPGTPLVTPPDGIFDYGRESFPQAVDFDGDGDLDILISEEAKSRVLLQDAPRVFSEPVELPVDLSPSYRSPLLAEDLDGDGVIDLVHQVAGNLVDVHLGTGPLAFDPDPQRLVVPGEAAPVQGQLISNPSLQGPLARDTHVLAADVDADGDRDLIVSADLSRPSLSDSEKAGEVAPPQVVVFLQSANGFDSDAIPVGPGSNEEDRQQVAAGDIDGDGLLDLVIADRGIRNANDRYTGKIAVQYQESPGVFEAGYDTIGSESPGGDGLDTCRVEQVQLADLDGDGDLDILAAHGVFVQTAGGITFPAHAGTLTIYWQTEPRVFAPVPTKLDPPAGNNEAQNTIAAADMNRDGRLDVVAQGPDGVVVYFQTEPGQFDHVPLILDYGQNADSLSQAPPFSMTPADLDGDGDLDLLYRNAATGEIEVRYTWSRGVEQFASEGLLVTGDPALDGAIDSVVADLDDDGDLDIATANGGLAGNASAANNYTIFRQTAPRLLESAPQVIQIPAGSPDGPQTFNPIKVEAADMDGDGDRDLVGVSMSSDVVQIFFQEDDASYSLPVSLGDFNPQHENPIIDSINTLVLRDLEGDGDLDVLTNTSYNARVYAFEQVTPTHYRRKFSIDHAKLVPELLESSERPFPLALAAGDLDDDGDLDLALSAGDDPDERGILLYEALGTEQFAPTPTLFEGGGDSDLRMVDVDGDGDLDIAATVEAALQQFPLPPVPGDVRLHLQQDDGTFVSSIVGTGTVPVTSLANSPPALRLADIDEDGDLDIFVHLNPGSAFFPFGGTGELAVIEQIAPGVFSPYPRTVPFNGSSVRVEDVDGDGEIDVVLPGWAFGASGRVRVLWGNTE